MESVVTTVEVMEDVVAPLTDMEWGIIVGAGIIFGVALACC